MLKMKKIEKEKKRKQLIFKDPWGTYSGDKFVSQFIPRGFSFIQAI